MNSTTCCFDYGLPRRLRFISEFVDALDDVISQQKSQKRLSKKQKYWIAFCLMAILATKSVCWAKFERVSGIRRGSLVIDDSDNNRSKNTKNIWYVYKLKDKASGGYIMGQSLVFMVLVIPTITIPVGVEFYMPDPESTAWKKENDRLKQQGIPSKQRPPRSLKNAKFPTKVEIAISMVKQFNVCIPNIEVNCIIADALYGTKQFFEGVLAVYKEAQIISQIRRTQNVFYRNRKQLVVNYFSKHPDVPQKIRIRGGKIVKVTIGSFRVQVCSHGKKLFVIAFRYEGENEYRYIIASDLENN